jgi:5'(3')-deoxyribonucleotidase
MEKRRLFFDMDGVLVDFQSGIDKLSDEVKKEYEDNLDNVPGIFALMEPKKGGIEAVHKLKEHYDVYILSTAPWKNPSAWSDKVAWITKHLEDVFYKRIVITHCKHLLCRDNNDYLIDDRTANGASEFGENLILFGSERYPNWESVLAKLLPDESCE